MATNAGDATRTAKANRKRQLCRKYANASVPWRLPGRLYFIKRPAAGEFHRPTAGWPRGAPGYPQCVRSCQGAQNLSRFTRFPFLPTAGRYDQHPGKFLEIFRDGGPNGQLFATGKFHRTRQGSASRAAADALTESQQMHPPPMGESVMWIQVLAPCQTIF